MHASPPPNPFDCPKLFPLKTGLRFHRIGNRPVLDFPREVWEQIRYPWDLLRLNAEFAALLQESDIQGVVPESFHCSGRLHLGKGSVILPGVFIEGNVIIGEGCKIGPNAYIRGNTVIGHRCRIGHAVELKNVLLGDDVSIAHLSYLGDSVVGDNVNFGAGTISANLRHDRADIDVSIRSERIQSGLKKFGVIIADGVSTGIHTALCPGAVLHANVRTLPGECVRGEKKS